MTYTNFRHVVNINQEKLNFLKTIRDIKKEDREKLRQAELERIKKRKYDLLSDVSEEEMESPKIK